MDSWNAVMERPGNASNFKNIRIIWLQVYSCSSDFIYAHVQNIPMKNSLKYLNKNTYEYELFQF